MIKQKIKNQKPIEIDAHLKYRCPKCGWDYWISLKESQTKNFKIVCDCNTVFSPKRIANLNIEYLKIKDKESVNIKHHSEHSNSVQINSSNVLDEKILDQCCKLLMGYGFTLSESKDLINKAYQTTDSTNAAILVKKSLEILGENNYDEKCDPSV